MDTREIIALIKNSEKRTPVKLYIKESSFIAFPGCKVFEMGASADGRCKAVFGDWKDVLPVLEENRDNILEIELENGCRNSAIPLMDIKGVNARIEPGAIIRGRVSIGDNAVIMMGAIINIGAKIGKGTMIDMGAILGARAAVGENCHIGAGAVIAGVIEPPCARPVIIEDDVVIGANAVVLEGCHVAQGAVVAAGAAVVSDVPENAVVAGVPARVIKMRDELAEGKVELVECIREL